MKGREKLHKSLLRGYGDLGEGSFSGVVWADGKLKWFEERK